MTPHQLGTIGDPWESMYAARAAHLTASEVRAMFAAISAPGVISFAGGNPAVDQVLASAVVTATAEALRRDHSALSYGPGQGIGALRGHITEVMAMAGTAAHPDDIVVTTGSQNAIELLAKVFVDPGDIVLTEAPCYLSALVVLRSYQADIYQVPIDTYGMIPAELEGAIVSARSQGRVVKFLYLVPSYQNPTGAVLPEGRRREILEIAARQHVLIVEDDPYGLLHFEAAPPAPLHAAHPDGVIYLGTFSKLLAPGFRIGWMAAPPAIRTKLILANEAAVLSPSSFTQGVVAAFLDREDWRGLIASFRHAYARRKDAMVTALARDLPQASVTNPGGGIFLWATLPGVDTKALLDDAVAAGVAYTPGRAFYADGRGDDSMRLCFSFPPPDQVTEGVRRLAYAVGEYVGVAASA